MWSRANSTVMIRNRWTTCWLTIDRWGFNLNISNKCKLNSHRRRCRMWMATIRGLREHRLLLHSWRAPWRPSRVRLQARRKGNGIITGTMFLPRSRLSTVKPLFVSWQGIWGGMIGGTCMQTAILLWVTLRTDWNKEVAITEIDRRYFFSFSFCIEYPWSTITIHNYKL